MYPDIKLLQATFQGLQSSLLQEEFSVVLEKNILLLPIKRTSFYLWNLSFAFHFDHKHLFQPLLEAKKWLKRNFWCWSFTGCQSKLGYFEKPMCEHKWTFGCGCEYHSLQCLSPLLKLSDKGQALLIITLVANIILHLFYFRVCATHHYYTAWWISEWLHFGKEAKETKSFYYLSFGCQRIFWDIL